MSKNHFDDAFPLESQDFRKRVAEAVRGKRVALDSTGKLPALQRQPAYAPALTKLLSCQPERAVWLIRFFLSFGWCFCHTSEQILMAVLFVNTFLLRNRLIHKLIRNDLRIVSIGAKPLMQGVLASPADSCFSVRSFELGHICRRQERGHVHGDAFLVVRVVHRRYLNIGVPEKLGRREETALRRDERASFLAQRVKRLVAFDAMSAQPVYQAVEDTLSAILAGPRFRRCRARILFEHEWARRSGLEAL
jgi:hypothetical protein